METKRKPGAQIREPGLTKQSYYRSYAINDRIFAEGDAREDVYIIENGSVTLSITGENGEVQVLTTLGAGEIFGEMALLGGGHRTATATAVEDTDVLVLPSIIMQESFNKLDPLMSLLMGLLVDRYRSSRQVPLAHAKGDDNDEMPWMHSSAAQSLAFQHWDQRKDTALQELKTAHDITRAIGDSEFIPFFQPIVDLHTDDLAGFETLIRWRHPTHGLVSPQDFMPVAERTNRAWELDMMMLRMACEIAPELNAIGSVGQKPVFISVNFAGTHFDDARVVAEIERILTETRTDPAFLKIEITESALVNEPQAAAQVLQELKQMGLKIALDDFGTGYSSLSYLHQFAIDTLKIDRSFVRNIHQDDKSENIVRAITALSKNFGMNVVAEGIEEKAQIDILKTLDCDLGQGFLFSRPLPLDEAFVFTRAKQV